MPLTREERENIQRIIKSGKSKVNDALKGNRKHIEEAKSILREKANKSGIKHNL